MFKRIIVSVIAVAVLVAVGGLLLPRVVHVTRSVSIDRPASEVFAVIDSFQLFPKWSPWQDLDPNMHQSAEGPREGVGAKLVWSGNDKVGSGTQLITAAVPDQFVDSDLDFGKMGIAKSRMILSPVGGGTLVTWTLDTDMGANPIGRYFGLGMDHMIGPDFAKGLAKLKTLAESLPNQDIAGLEVIPVQLTALPVLLTSEIAAPDAIAKAYTDGFSRIAKFMAKNKLVQSGPPFSIDAAQSPGGYSFQAGIPVDRGDAAGTDDIRIDKSYGGKALKTVHTGPYAGMIATHDKLLTYLSAHGYARNGAAFYRFVDDPGNTPEPQLHTEIYAPIE
jgi:effector-binding domain-containing protein